MREEQREGAEMAITLARKVGPWATLASQPHSDHKKMLPHQLTLLSLAFCRPAGLVRQPAGQPVWTGSQAWHLLISQEDDGCTELVPTRMRASRSLRLPSWRLNQAFREVAGAMHQLQRIRVATWAMAETETIACRQGLLWKEFFSDPSKWWDNRRSKRSPDQPDFKHKVTKVPLWMDGPRNPCWVTEELVKHGFSIENQCIATIGASDALSPSLIWACCQNKDLLKGTRIHHELQQRGFVEKEYVDALVTMYAKCGALQKAQALLDMHRSRNVVPWTALIAGYVQQGRGQNALDCFEQMQFEGIVPNAVTCVCALKACALVGTLDKGKQIHNEISRQRLLENNIVLGGALVDMYARCGALPQAQSVLERLPSRNVICWGALITGYAQKKQGQQAIECFEQMQGECINPDAVTYASVLKACAAIRDLDRGMEIHDEIAKQGLLEHNIVVGTALVDMYAKCGVLSQAQSVLEKLPHRNIVSWNALIAGYIQTNQGEQALECFGKLRRDGIHPSAVTYACILKACAMTGAIDKGKQVHNEISRQGLLEHNIVVGTALVDMYAQCGALDQARSILKTLPSRDVVCWSALIAGYAEKKQGQQALECFEQMQHDNVAPDMVTFLCLLNLCSHLGLTEKGQELFDSMEAIYGLKPDIECYTCMVDLLGRTGQLVKAVELIQGMPFLANSAMWHCLLGACRKWVDVNVGTWAFEQAVELDMYDGAAYAVMLYIYAAAGKHFCSKSSSLPSRDCLLGP